MPNLGRRPMEFARDYSYFVVAGYHFLLQSDISSSRGFDARENQFVMTPTTAFTLDFAAATDIGCQRSNNEDSFGYDAEEHLYVVCDGMGGSAAGEVASGTAVRALIESFEALGLEGTGSQPPPPVARRLAESIARVNRHVWQTAAVNPQLHGMGTTLVCACLDGSQLVLGNVGDSRGYLIRNGVCTQVTLDHSFLAEQVRSGNFTPEMAANSNLQSAITRAIGVVEEVEVDLFAVGLELEDMFLLASDGLTRYLQPEEIAATVTASADLAPNCQNLIGLAKARGGADNITCILLRVGERGESEAPPPADASSSDAPSSKDELDDRGEDSPAEDATPADLPETEPEPQCPAE